MQSTSLIGKVMKAYRSSRFHNARNGRVLAWILGRLVRTEGQQHSVKEIDGIWFDLDLGQVIDSSLYFSGTFEPQTESLIEKYLKPGMTALDIGANVGYHTFRMARLSQPQGTVYAIEPSAWAVERLQNNARLNPSLSNIHICKAGFSDRDEGLVKMNFKSSYALDGKEVLTDEEETEVIQLDTFVDREQILKVDFIKMDVDGFEGKVFKGARQTLHSDHPIWLFEITPSVLREYAIDPVQMLEELQAEGYTLFTEDERLIASVKEFIAGQAKGDSSMILARVVQQDASVKELS